jgi:hypothetical protein
LPQNAGIPSTIVGMPLFICLHGCLWTPFPSDFVPREDHPITASTHHRCFRTHTVSFIAAIHGSNPGGHNLARSNYKFQKRQKELARKKKKEEKRQRKLEKNNPNPEEMPEQEQTDQVE